MNSPVPNSIVPTVSPASGSTNVTFVNFPFGVLSDTDPSYVVSVVTTSPSSSSITVFIIVNLLLFAFKYFLLAKSVIGSPFNLYVYLVPISDTNSISLVIISSISSDSFSAKSDTFPFIFTVTIPLSVLLISYV